LQTVQFFRDTWEATEIRNLEADIKRKVHNLEADKTYKEMYEAMDNAELEVRAEAAN